MTTSEIAEVPFVPGPGKHLHPDRVTCSDLSAKEGVDAIADRAPRVSEELNPR